MDTFTAVLIFGVLLAAVVLWGVHVMVVRHYNGFASQVEHDFHKMRLELDQIEATLRSLNKSTQPQSKELMS